MSRADQRARLIVARNDRGHWGWEILVGTWPIVTRVSDNSFVYNSLVYNSFVSRRAAQAAGKVAMQRLVARLQDKRAFDRYSNLQRGTPALDRKVLLFVGKRIDRLLSAAARCHNAPLQCDLVRMAEWWMQEDPGQRRSVHSRGEIDAAREGNYLADKRS